MKPSRRFYLAERLTAIVECLITPRPKFRSMLRWWTGPQSFIEGIKMRLTTEQRVKVTVNPITAGGRPAVIDGKVSFTSSDTAVANIQDHESDLNSAYVVAVGEGAAQITATFDARMGTEVREVTASGSVEIVSPEAERGEIVFGTPEQL